MTQTIFLSIKTITALFHKANEVSESCVVLPLLKVNNSAKCACYSSFSSPGEVGEKETAKMNLIPCRFVFKTVFFLAGLHPKKRRGGKTQAVRFKLPTADVRQNRRRSRYYHPPRGERIYHAWRRCYFHHQAHVRHCD